QVEIPRPPADRFALARDADELSLAHPGRNPDLETVALGPAGVGIHLLNRDRPHGPVQHLVEGHEHIVLEIAAAHADLLETESLRAGGTPAEQGLEELAEAGAAEAEFASSARAAARPAIPTGRRTEFGSGPPVGAQAIVSAAVLGIAQHLV